MEALKNREEAAAAVRRYAHLEAQLGAAAAARKAAVDKALKTNDALIASLSNTLKEYGAVLEEWAEANPEEFGEKRSTEFSFGWLQFRKGQRKLDCLARWTEEKVIAKLLAFPVTSQWAEYVRRDPEVNRQKLLEDTKEGGKLPVSKLKEIGLKITVGESFSIKTKPEAVAGDVDLMP